MFFRRRTSASRFLEWKIRTFVLAVALAFVGIYSEERWMTGAAIAVLAAGLLLRFVPASANHEDGHATHDGDGHATHDEDGHATNAEDGHATHAEDGHATHAEDGHATADPEQQGR